MASLRADPSAYIITEHGIAKYYIHSRVIAEELAKTDGVDFVPVPHEKTYNDRLESAEGITPPRRLRQEAS